MQCMHCAKKKKELNIFFKMYFYTSKYKFINGQSKISKSRGGSLPPFPCLGWDTQLPCFPPPHPVNALFSK